MKGLYKALNEVKIDISEYKSTELTDLEKQSMKKRVKKKLRGRKKINKLRVGGIAAAVIIMFSFGLSSNMITLAKVPIIGPLLEDYLKLSDDQSLEDYKTVIGQTVEDKRGEITLNEVLIDEGQLIVNSTFHSSEDISEKSLSPFPSIYIDGEHIVGGAGGDVKMIDESTYTFFSATDIKNIELNKILKVKVVYQDIGMSSRVDGKWEFEFQASGESLFIERKVIPIGKEFLLENGQQIIVDEIVFTPVSTTLNYQMLSEEEYVYDYDVHFVVEDETGKKYDPTSASTLGKKSHIRFEVLDEKVMKLKLTPYLISGKEGQEKTDYHKVLSDEEFEIDLKP